MNLFLASKLRYDKYFGLIGDKYMYTETATGVYDLRLKPFTHGLTSPK